MNADSPSPRPAVPSPRPAVPSPGPATADPLPQALTRASFRRLNPMRTPRQMALLPERVWTEAEWDRIRRGCRAGSMDERWNAFAEGDILYVHRSWTGHCVYEATFTPVPEGGLRITAARVEQDPERCRPMGDAYDRLMLELVVSTIVLGEPAGELRERLRNLAAERSRASAHTDPGPAGAVLEHSALGRTPQSPSRPRE
ncbi:hypothetical protein [Streptomyces sp. Da 82-17]|uniref:hypothetical protein n=1 Tax=Streptomyces sp. Da 82-17 TaxID=3377116 RepID=UPI0038D4956C